MHRGIHLHIYPLCLAFRWSAHVPSIEYVFFFRKQLDYQNCFVHTKHMSSVDKVEAMTPYQKLEFFKNEWREHCAVYGEKDPDTDETYISLGHIFDMFLELSRLRYGADNVYFATNAARLCLD